MGELSEAYEFLDRNISLDNVSLIDARLSIFRAGLVGAAAEATMKSYIAGRDGLSVSARQLNEDYEIKMELVPRRGKLPAEGQRMLDQLEKANLLLPPNTAARGP